MNKRFFWLLGTALTAATSLSGQSKRGPLEGVWQVAEVTLGGGQIHTIRPGSNLTIITARYYTRVEVQTEKSRPVLANAHTATAEQLREVWGPLVAEAGTYELTENVMTLRPIVAKNPAALASGVSIVYTYNLEGNTLRLTLQRDRNGPVANPFTLRLVRIE